MTTRRAVPVWQDYWADCTQYYNWLSAMMVREFILLIPLVLVVVDQGGKAPSVV